MTNFATLKERAFGQLHALAAGADPQTAYHAGARLWACHPFNEREGIEEIRRFWSVLRTSFPDLERRDLIFVVGASTPDERASPDLAGRPLVASTTLYQGSFAADFLGIPATNSVVQLRSCEVHHVVDGRIAHSYVLLDLLDLMRQAGVWPLPPSLGAEGAWQGPATGDGVRIGEHDAARGAQSLRVVLAMHAALGAFDGRSVESMPLASHWSEHFMWYGPSGIGTTRGLRGFRAHHQVPFLTGFPDRRGAGHYIRIGDGDYVVTGGWPSVVGTHRGEWLGLPPTGRRIEMRVMDFYRLEGGTIVENWVPIDILHILLQMGLDVLARLKHLRGEPRLDLPV